MAPEGFGEQQKDNGAQKREAPSQQPMSLERALVHIHGDILYTMELTKWYSMGVGAIVIGNFIALWIYLWVTSP